MEKPPYKIKLSYIWGLQDIVIQELKNLEKVSVIKTKNDAIYLDSTVELKSIISLKSILTASVVLEGKQLNPGYIDNHKSLLDELMYSARTLNPDKPKTFKITCAGNDSPEVRSIAKYIADKYDVVEQEAADLKIHIIKSDDMWEVGVGLTRRPLSVRSYRVENIPGAMNPTIAHAVNSLCDLENKTSYLNIFSGSGTLLIEAAQEYENLKTVIGFDNNKTHLTASIRNIKEAGLIQKVQIVEKDLFDKPELGNFDVIASDMPFGMIISKEHDLTHLYTEFIAYCESHLNTNGVLALYTTEYETLRPILENSKFAIDKNIKLKFITNSNSNIYPEIFVCKLK